MISSPSVFVRSPNATSRPPTLIGDSPQRSPLRTPALAAALILALGTLLVGIALVSRPTPALAAQASEIIVRAHGDSGEEQMVLHVNGDEVIRWTVSTSPSDYVFTTDEPIEVTTVEVEFANDRGISRDLIVDYIDVGGIVLQSEGDGTISTGTFGRNGGCIERATISQTLHCSGSFFYDVPASAAVTSAPTPASSELNLRVFGRTGSEQIEVRINDETVLSATLAEGWQDLAHSLDDVEITGAEVHFVNDSGPRDVRVDYLEVDGERYESEDSSTRVKGAWDGSCTDEQPSSSEWIYCRGYFRYDVNGTAAVTPVVEVENTETSADGTTAETVDPAEDTTVQENASTQDTNAPDTTAAPEETDEQPATEPESTTTTSSTTTSTTTTTTTTTAPVQQNDDPNQDNAAEDETQTATDLPRAVGNPTSGRYTIAQVIDGTISAGDGSNPNEESPMGRHDAPLALNQGWNWAQGPTRNSVWGQLGSGNSRYAEFRCAVIPERGHTPSVPFRINVGEAAYYQFANGDWNKGFDVDLTGGNHGGYLGTAGGSNTNPFTSGSHGLIQWRQEADGTFSAPWNPSALMMHFWAAQREAPAAGQTAEFLTSEVRLQQPDGQTVDLSQVRVLFQCGVDYYSTTGGQGTQVPGPGIGKYHRVTESWTPGLWVTLPRNTPANSVADFENWLSANTPPNVR